MAARQTSTLTSEGCEFESRRECLIFFPEFLNHAFNGQGLENYIYLYTFIFVVAYLLLSASKRAHGFSTLLVFFRQASCHSHSNYGLVVQ